MKSGKSVVINDIARRLAEVKGGTIKSREEQIEEVFDILRSVLLDSDNEVGDRVFIKGLGIFKLKLRSGRIVTNHLGSFEVPARYTWAFKPASSFVKNLNA